MDAYASAVRSVNLSGPTLFGPVINMAAKMAAESLASYNSAKYYVLLIITVRKIINLIHFQCQTFYIVKKSQSIICMYVTFKIVLIKVKYFNHRMIIID
jgi:hypothetical protein